MLKRLFLSLITLLSISSIFLAQNVELKIQMGHTGKITSVDLSSDDNLIVSAGIDGSVRLWEFNTERELRSFYGHTRAVSSVCFSPDNKNIASAGYDKMVYIWDVVTGKKVQSLRGHEEGVNSVDYSSDGKFLVSAGEKVIIWDVVTGNPVKTFFDYSTVYMYPGIACVRFSPDNKYVSSLTLNGKVVIWDIKAGRKSKEFYINKKTEPDKREIKIFFADFEGSDYTDPIRMTDSARINRLKSIKSILQKDNPSVSPTIEVSTSLLSKINIFSNNSLAFSPDSRYIFAGDTMFVRKELVTGEEVVVENFLNDLPFKSIAVNSDGLLYILKGNILGVIRMNNDSLNFLFKDKCSASVMKPLNTKSGLLLGGYGGDISAHLLNRNRLDFLKQYYPIANPVGYASFNFTGSLLATGMNSWDKSVRIWDLKKAEEIAAIDINRQAENKVTHIEFAPFDFINVLLVTTDSMPELTNVGPRGGNGTMHLFASEKEKSWIPFKRITIPDGIYTASFNPDPNSQECAVAGGLGNIFVLDYMKGTKKNELTGHNEWITSIKYSNANYIFSGAFSTKHIKATDLGGEIKIFSVKDSKPVKEYVAPDQKGIYSIDVSRRGQLIAGGGSDIFVYMVNLDLMKPLSGHTAKVNSVDCSPDDKWLVSGSDDQSIRIWDLEFSKPVHNLPIHKSNVNSVQFSPDNKFVISASNDGTAKLINPIKGEEIVTFISTEYPVLNGKSEYDFVKSSIVVTPDNYYMCPEGKPAGINFVQGLKSYSFEQFDMKYNRPDIILKRIGLASEEMINTYYKAYQKRLAKLNFTEEMLSSDWHIPEIKLENKDAIPGTTSTKELSLKLNASDSKYFLDRINIWVNNVPVYGSNGLDLRNEKTKAVKKSVNLMLSQGNNRIEISALNEKGAESFKETIWISCSAPQVKPDLYIIGIGISEYQDSRMNLEFAAKDALDLANQFSSDKKDYGNVHTIKLLNRDATREKIREVKKTLMQSKVDDMVVLFVAGHGLLDKDLNYYLATYNIDFSNPSVNGLPYDDLEKLLDGIPARKKLMLIDACHSGELDKDELVYISKADLKDKNVVFRGSKNLPSNTTTDISYVNSFELMKELFADLRRGTGAIVISSAGGGEFAFEGKQWRNGVFTYSVLDGLKTGFADVNKDGVVVASELRDFVMKKVQELTDGRQNPTSRRDNLQFDFRVW